MKKLFQLLISSLFASVLLYLAASYIYEYDVSFVTVVVDFFPLHFMALVLTLLVAELNDRGKK